MKSSCSTCSRRAVLQGLGLAVLGACASDPKPPSGTATTCSGGLCLDLADPANAMLTSVGGAVAIDAPTDTILVVRTSDTEVVAVSAICTHDGCENLYTASSKTFDCPCHGSQFSLTGTVLRGPARRSLKVYAATLASNTITITV
jgi:cytochrome b6-f complex iron-sulfur subunit